MSRVRTMKKRKRVVGVKKRPQRRMSPLKQARQFTLLSYQRYVTKTHQVRSSTGPSVPKPLLGYQTQYQLANLILTIIEHRPGRRKLQHHRVPGSLPRLQINLPQQSHLRPVQPHLLPIQALAKLVRLPLSLVKQQRDSNFSWIL